VQKHWQSAAAVLALEVQVMLLVDLEVAQVV
jgi:hypothetical protein